MLLLSSLAQAATTQSAPTQAHFLSKCYNTKYGQTVRAQIKTNEKLESACVQFQSQKYPLVPLTSKKSTYECYIPIECEGATGSFPLRATISNSNRKLSINSSITIHKRTFPKAKGFKASSSFLKKKVNKESLASNKNKKKTAIWERGGRPSELLKKMLLKSPQKPLWSGKFIIPTKVLRYSTPFGEIRNSSNWGTYLHKGVDIVSPRRHPVKASQNGKIIVKQRLQYPGNHIVIDHGLGVFTYYLHLDSFANRSVGSFVKKGDIIGRVGNTGYSTGYHLHWSLSVQNKLVDPLEWTTEKFN